MVTSTLDPTIKFTLRCVKERDRIEREIMLFPLREKFEAFQDKVYAFLTSRNLERPQLEAEYAAILADAPRARAFQHIANQRDYFTATEWFPAWIRWGITDVVGFGSQWSSGRSQRTFHRHGGRQVSARGTVHR